MFFGSSFPKEPGGLLYTEGGERRIQSYAAFTSDGGSSPQPVYEPDFWLWQVERFGEVSYGTAYNREGRLGLARSTGGRNWETVSEIPPDRFKSTEAGLWVKEAPSGCGKAPAWLSSPGVSRHTRGGT